METYECGIISAYRGSEGVCGEGPDIPNKTNRRNHRLLQNDLRRMGYFTTQGDSWFKEYGTKLEIAQAKLADRTPEEVEADENLDRKQMRKKMGFSQEQSIFVADEQNIGGLKEALKKLGLKYNQDSVIYTDLETRKIYIEDLKTCGDSVVKGRISAASMDSTRWGRSENDFYTEIGGRDFSFHFPSGETPISEQTIRVTGPSSSMYWGRIIEQEREQFFNESQEEFRLNESLALKGDYKGGIFQRLVAAVYQTMPLYTESHRYAWEELIDKFSRQKEFLSREFEMVKATEDPYPSSKAMSRDIKKQQAEGKGRVKVKTFAEEPSGAKDDEAAFQGHPVFSNDENVDVRFVHDVIAHFYGSHPFSARGEYAAYNRHTKTLGVNTAATQALFTEVVAQTSCYYVYGDYVEQKATLMTNYFNPTKVGALAENSPFNRYFELVDKELVKKKDFDGEKFLREFPKIGRELIRQERLKASLTPLEPIF